MKIAVAQLNPEVGGIQENVKKIQDAYKRACAEQARFLLTPELSLCGYPLHDLIDRPELVAECDKALEQLAALTVGKKTALFVGHVARNSSERGRAYFNRVSILENGKVVFAQNKTLLPTYDVFDEARYFEPAREIKLWNCDGVPIAVAICEDLWAEDSIQGRVLYETVPVREHERLGAQLLISISASPYIWGKRERREAIHRGHAKALDIPLVYVNQICGNDELLFDGSSFAVHAGGELACRLPIFKSGFALITVEPKKGGRIQIDPKSDLENDPCPEIETLRRGLVRGLQDYFERTGFKKVVLGLSGGIDSAVVGTLSAQALGPQSVLGVAMPSQYSSAHSLEDSEILAQNLGIGFQVRPIKFSFSTLKRELSEGIEGELASIAQENLQSRLRGVTLMTLSNHWNALVLNTGNKSELAMGYCTLYGDMCGALSPLGDLLKMRVYELARHLNDWALKKGETPPIPERSITKAPSAELRPGQKDQDSLPPYPLLDEIITQYVEKLAPVEQLITNFLAQMSREEILKIIQTLERNEYKRRQAAPVLKTSARAFGVGRRMPLASRW